VFQVCKHGFLPTTREHLAILPVFQVFLRCAVSRENKVANQSAGSETGLIKPLPWRW
jgi:hypothetical protein